MCLRKLAQSFLEGLLSFLVGLQIGKKTKRALTVAEFSRAEASSAIKRDFGAPTVRGVRGPTSGARFAVFCVGSCFSGSGDLSHYASCAKVGATSQHSQRA